MSTTEMDPFDPQRLKASPGMVAEVLKRRRLPRHKQGEEFVMGPIPIAWLKRAAELRGKALAVAIALWFKAGAQGNNAVKLGAALLNKLGVGRKAGYRGLAALEKAGLVAVQRHRGRCPIVCVLPVPSDSSDERAA